MPLKERPRGTNLSHSLYVQQSTGPRNLAGYFIIALITPDDPDEAARARRNPY